MSNDQFLLLQFMYDPTGVGERMRKHVFINLGLWHTYKHVSLLIWRKFGQTIIAGLWHFLYPDGSWFSKPKLQIVTKIFTLIRLAYPSFKKDLEEALAIAHELREQTRVCLQNLQDLIEYFIPAVN